MKYSYQVVSCRVPEKLRTYFLAINSLYKSAVKNNYEEEFIEKFKKILQELNESTNSEKTPSPNIYQSSEDTVKPTETIPKIVINKNNFSNLTSSQQEAFTSLMGFIRNSKAKYFRLSGYAGTGKSFLMVELMRWLMSGKLNFVAAAPTNKAAKNLQNLANKVGLDIECTTIAKLLGQQPELNKETGKEEFLSAEDVDLSTYQVIILDEFSMISKANFEEIVKASKKEKTKVIFVGDAAQLPPVGEEQPIVATSNLIVESATLTEVVRFEGKIGQVAEEIRSNNIYTQRFYPYKTTEDQSIICLKRQEWLTTASHFFKSEQYQTNSDFCRILVWRNKTADSLNNWIRGQLWGKDASSYVKGDRLIARKPVFRSSSNYTGKSKYQWTILMNNSEECTILEEPKLIAESKLPYWAIPVITDDETEITIRILTPKAEQERQKLLQEYSAAKKWDKYQDLDKRFDYCSFAYCITTHKAQGSTIEHIFIDPTDMILSDDRQKLQYTALTRAKIRAYIPLG
jgi:DNA replication protein DnaC